MDLRSEVLKNMRGCITSTKDRLSVRQLNKDYRTIIGEFIPFQRLGYRTLEEFIESAPSEFIVSKGGNEYYVGVRESEKSAHMLDMVAKQRPAKKKPTRMRFYRAAPPLRPQQVAKWRPKSNIPDRYQVSQRPQAVSYSQFVNKSPTTTVYKAPTVASKVVIPKHSTFNSRPQPDVVGRSQPEVVAVTVPPAVKKDMNHRLTSNRVKENMKALITKELNGTPAVTPVLNGTSSHNNISNKPNTFSSHYPKPVNEQPVIKDTSLSLNPLVSAKKRLAKKMSELSLDRDSGNSSPTSEILPPSPSDRVPPSPSEIIIPLSTPILPPLRSKTPDFIRTGDPLKDLKSFAELHKLGEVTVKITRINQKRDKNFYCLIKIGSDYTYKNYPLGFLTQLESQNHCCELALDDLIPKFKRKSLMIASDRDILERIPPMLEKHTNGIWASQVKLDYSDKYNELLSEDWLQVIDISPCVQMERISNDCILYHCRPGDKGQRRSVAVPVSNVSVPSNTISSSEDGRLNANVTCVMSAEDIWCQQTETEESILYEKMMDRLQIYYQEHAFQLIPTNISKDCYYIAKYEEEYYRVKAVQVSELEVDCFFIDWGDKMSIARKEVYDLKREYASAQAQAFVCRLYGLEELYEVSTNSQALANLCEKPVVIEIALDVADNAHTNVALPVYMYDGDTGKSINEDLISKLTVELATPNLTQGVIMEVFVSNIESNGDVYVQVRSKGYENWAKLKRQIEEEINANAPKDMLYKVAPSNSREKLYFFKVVDGSWHRIKLIDWSPDGEYAQMYFVDDGRAVVIKVANEELYPLEALNDIFNNYPYQAVRVRMSLEKIPANFVALASKLMPADQPVLLKIEATTEDNIPTVNLFRRNPDGLFSINTSIAYDAEIKKEENNNTKSKYQFGVDCVPSTGALRCPPLPETDSEDYFHIYVPFAVSPYNFFVQPMESKPQLNDMMERLQEVYEDVQYGHLTVDEVLPGSIYASKNDDGFWYRTSVIKVIHSGSVSVYYCDFGYYQTLPVKHLIPLDREFMELPYQALKAKLADIKPTQSKWTMEDCERFKELIEKKQLHSKVVKIEKDVLYESDLVLIITNLVDTTTADDIYIENELVERGIAVKDCRE